MSGLSDNDGGLNFGDSLVWQDAIGGGSLIVVSGLVMSPGTGHAEWTGYTPLVTGVEYTFASPGIGAATWIGYAPSVSLPVVISPGFGSATWTGYAPTVQGLVSEFALEWGSGNALDWGSGNEMTWGT